MNHETWIKCPKCKQEYGLRSNNNTCPTCASKKDAKHNKEQRNKIAYIVVASIYIIITTLTLIELWKQ